MAWYRCGGGGSGKDRLIYETLKLHSGKISNATGEVVEDSTFYYTDYFPCPNGNFTFDMGYTSRSETYAGVTMYKEDKSYTSNWYWNPTERYRNKDVSSYYSQGARFLRFSFPADKFQYIMLHDWINGIMYSTEEVVRITDEDIPVGNSVQLMSKGQVSTTSDYATAYFDNPIDISAYDFVLCTLWRGDSYGSSVVTEYGSFDCRAANWGHTLNLQSNYITCTYYSGAFVDLYVDVYGIKVGNVALTPKTITENGIYSAQDDGVDGYSEVTVDVKEYVDITSFAHYFRRNTSTPTVTHISSTEVSLTFQDQNNSGYELSSYSVSLEKGIYVADIYATVNKNTIQSQYTWGIYSCNSSGWATVNNNSPMDNEGIDTYVPFDTSDTNEHYYEVPIKMLADGTAYIGFAMAADDGVNATVTVRSLKIRKV